MRNFFLALLLANLLYAGWRYWIVPPDVPADELRNVAAEAKITALARPATDMPRATAPTRLEEPQAAGPPDGDCVRIGPIAEGLAVDRLRTRLATAGFEASAFAEDGQIWVGHWVQIDSVASRQAADAMVARLAAGGVPDAYVFQTAPPFSISLGVFRDRARAEAVAGAAAKLGYRPQITDRYRPGTQYWVTVLRPGERVLPDGILDQEGGQRLPTRRIACPAEAGSPNLSD